MLARLEWSKGGGGGGGSGGGGGGVVKRWVVELAIDLSRVGVDAMRSRDFLVRGKKLRCGANQHQTTATATAERL